MSIVTDIVRVAADIDTAPYTQDIVASLDGLTPKAVVITVTYATVDDTLADDFVLSYGAATGASNEWAISSTDEDAQGSSDAQSSVSSSYCIRIHNPGSSTFDGEAELSSFSANTLTINWTNAPAAAYLITVEFYAGSDLTAHANYEDLGDVLNNVVNVTNPGVASDIVISACRGGLSVGGNTTSIDTSYGLVHINGGVSQRCFTATRPQGAASGAPDGRCTESYGIMQIDSSANLDWGGEFTTHASGFTVTTRIAGANGTDLCYLALNFGGVVSAWVGTVDSPILSGNDSQTGPSFTPQFVKCLLTQMEAIDTAYNSSALAGPIGFSAFNSSNKYSNAVMSEDGVATTNTQSLSDDRAVNIPDDDGVTGLEATYVSMDANGWTWNFSAVEANAKKFLVMVIEEETIAGAIMPQLQGPNLGSSLYNGTLL